MWRKWVCHLCELISTPSVFQRFFCESETRNNARYASLIVKKKKKTPKVAPACFNSVSHLCFP